MKASDYIVEFLVQNEIDKVFGYIGGAVANFYDSLDKNSSIETVNTIHEQGAGFAAEGYARVSGKTGVATATSGPGATNLITPIGSCYFDSVPTLFITGQVNTYEYKYDQPVRQIGFQETDIVSIIKPITKYAVMVNKLEDLRYELEKSYYLSQHGRKGPVLIDIPMNIQRADFQPEEEKSFYDSEEFRKYEDEHADTFRLQEIKELLEVSKRPVILLGGGARISNAEQEIYKFLTTFEIPVVHSLMGKDIVKDSYKLNLGLIGAYGNRYGNLSLANSDLIIVLGSRLDTRQTGTDLKTFAREAKIVQVDIDVHELGSKIRADILIQSDIKAFVAALNTLNVNMNISMWKDKLLSYKEKFPSVVGIDQNDKVPNQIIHEISKYLSDDDIVCVDVGQHQMWVAQSLDIRNDQRVLFSGGMGAMGCALPTAIGAALSQKKRAIVIVGDGGFQMNIQELEILRRRNLPIKIFVMNNANLGMVRQFQEIYFEENYAGTKKDYSVPDFEKIASAYGIKSCTVSNISDIYKTIQKALTTDIPELVNIELVESLTTVEPKLIVNKPIEDMYPFLDRDEFKSQMIIKPVDDE